MLLAHDIIAFGLLLMLIYRIRLDYQSPSVLDWHVFGVVLLLVGALYVFNTYNLNSQISANGLVVRTFCAVLVTGLLIGSYIYLAEPRIGIAVLWRGNLPPSLFIFALWAALIRYAMTTVNNRWRRKPTWLFIALTDRAIEFEKQGKEFSSDRNLVVVTYKKSEDDLTLSKAIDDIVEVRKDDEQIYAGEIDGLVLQRGLSPGDKLVNNLMQLRMHGLKILDFTEYYEQQYGRVPISDIEDDWFVISRGFSLLHHDLQLKTKRLIDLFVSGVGLVLSVPILLLLAILVPLDNPGPVFYSQMRVGLNGKLFKPWKVRTMTVDAEKSGIRWTEPRDKRITRIGQSLRRLRLDEIPQFWNVLVGQMSFVGPRPERPEHIKILEANIPYYDVRHLVKPGITGWAQVMYHYGGASKGATERKLEYDLYYIKNYSLILDAHIVLKTLRVVLSRSGQ